MDEQMTGPSAEIDDTYVADQLPPFLSAPDRLSPEYAALLQSLDIPVHRKIALLAEMNWLVEEVLDEYLEERLLCMRQHP